MSVGVADVLVHLLKPRRRRAPVGASLRSESESDGE
jgi:hypothetical protein